MELKTGRELLLDIRTKISEFERHFSENGKDLTLKNMKRKFLTIERVLDKMTLKLSSSIQSLNSLISDLRIKQKERR